MKFYILISIAIFIVGANCINEEDYPRKPPPPLIQECVEMYQIDAAALNEIIANKSFSDKHNVQCFAACLMDESGIMTPAGKIHESYLESAPGKKCHDLRGENECEIAANMLNCLYKNDFIAMI